MSNLLEVIKKEVDINTNHITNYPLETEEGTKKVKLNFHKNAVIERNKYVTKEIDEFSNYKKKIYLELKRRVDKLLPKQKDEVLAKKKAEMEALEELVILNSDYYTSSYKLKLDFLLYEINDEISLNKLNSLLVKFFKIFEDMNKALTIDDFNYSLFASKYMQVFLENYKNNDLDEKTNDIFQEIYFECPDIIEHLKMNLMAIIKKYLKELNASVTLKLDNYLISKNIEKTKIKDLYLTKRTSLEDLLLKDEYNNLNAFLEKKKNIIEYLDGAAIRTDNFNHFAINNDFGSLDRVGKEKYEEAVIELYHVLIELQEYYRYEEIIKDLIAKFKERTTSIVNYKNKEKEINKEEKVREGLLKKYLRATGVGFLAKEDPEKIKLYKLQLNAQIKKLRDLYEELNDLRIYVDLDNLNDASSIYCLYTASLLNFTYLKKQFIKMAEENKDESFDVEAEFLRYFRFLYSPYNEFLQKINGLTDYDIADIIADKYKLLGLNITKEDVQKDTIKQTFETVSFNKLVYDIEGSKLPIKDMHFIFNFKAITPDFDVSEDIILDDQEIL